MKIEKVLLVDDDPNIRIVAQMSLEDVGQWQVILAASGAEALAAVRQECPDLILLDIMMPEMDGVTTFIRLKESAAGCTIPVIFLTAKIQEHEIESYLSLGAAGIIAKPFDPLSLPDRIRQIVGAS